MKKLTPLLLLLQISSLAFSQGYSFQSGHTNGGSEEDNVNSLHLGEHGNIYRTGLFRDSVDFDPDTSSTHYLVSNLLTNKAFVQKLDKNENLVWAHAFGTLHYHTQGTGICTDKQGNVVDVTIMKSDHPAFGPYAVNAVRKWKFEPGMQNGEPVPFTMDAPITFSIIN